MNLMIQALLVLLVVSGAGVVFTRKPRRQVMAIAAHGLVMGLLFMALQAPDAAFSQIVVGTVALPLFFFVVLAMLRKQGEDA
jgi:uncharacterized MnhB-related membrane protein